MSRQPLTSWAISIPCSCSFYRKNKNKEWITSGTWQKIEKRKQLKANMLSTKPPRLKEQAQEAYKMTNREVKKSARNDKRAFAEELAGEAEQEVR